MLKSSSNVYFLLCFCPPLRTTASSTILRIELLSPRSFLSVRHKRLLCYDFCVFKAGLDFLNQTSIEFLHVHIDFLLNFYCYLFFLYASGARRSRPIVRFVLLSVLFFSCGFLFSFTLDPQSHLVQNIEFNLFYGKVLKLYLIAFCVLSVCYVFTSDWHKGELLMRFDCKRNVCVQQKLHF